MAVWVLEYEGGTKCGAKCWNSSYVNYTIVIQIIITKDEPNGVAQKYNISY